MFQNKKPGSVQRNRASRPLVARQDGWWRDQLGMGLCRAPIQPRVIGKVPKVMQSSSCKQCDRPLVEIDHWGERLTGCPKCNRWQTSLG
jgi:hypothetical protein